MLMNTQLTAEKVVTELFGKCLHKNKAFDEKYCPDCKMHPDDVEIVKEFLDSFKKTKAQGINGGLFAQKIIRFILRYGNLHFQIGHDLCMEILKEDGTSAYYYGKSSNSFLINLCTFLLALFYYRVSEGDEKEDLRRILNA